MCKRMSGGPRPDSTARPRPRWAPLLSLLCCLSALHQPCLRAQTRPESTALAPGQAVEREITGGETQFYQITASAGQFISVTLEQRGVDVSLEVSAADQEWPLDFDSEMRKEGREQGEFVAETSGTYRLAVKAQPRNAPAGSYVIRLTETRVATNDDRALQEARKLFTRFARLHRAGKYDEARPFVIRAEEIAAKVLGANHVYVARLMVGRGDSYHAKVDYPPAIPLYERALAILEKELGPEHPLTASVINRLGNSYHHLALIAKADKFLERALEISEKTLGPDHPQVAQCLLNLGQMLENRGDLTKVESLYLRALAIADKSMEPESLFRSAVQNNLGVHYLARRDYERAELFLQQSLLANERARGPEHQSLANVLQNLGIISREKKDYERAEQYYWRALAIREKAVGPDHPDIAANLNNIANLYRAKGDYAKSLEVHLRSLDILEKGAGPNHWITIISLGNIARTYAAMGHRAKAIEFQARVDAAIETYIALNIVIGSERQKLAFLNGVSERTERTLSLSLQLAPGDPGANSLAARTLLQRKGRVLDAMTDTLAAVRQRSDPRGQSLLDQWNETTTRLAKLVLNGPQKMAPAEHQQAIRELEEKKEQLETSISRESAEFRAQTQPVTLEAVQAAIPDTAALVELATYRPFDPKAESNREAYGETRYAAFVIRRRGVPEGKDLGAAREIDEAVDALRQALQDPARRDVRALAQALDERIMRPLRPLLGDATHLLISPDGSLNLIPFEALVDETGRYLIQRYTFTYLTSGRDLLRLQIAREGRSQPLVVANPSFGEPEPLAKTDGAGQSSSLASRRRSVTAARDLSDTYFAPLGNTAREAQTIHRLFPEASLLTGAHATESALKRVVAPRLLHIATHGFFLQGGETAGPNRGDPAGAAGRIDNPLLRAGLALAGANVRPRQGGDSGGGTQDGILTALEASGLNLWGTKLVVLSACDTGVGEVRQGEGVYGLRRAFLLAGAESLLMSLWPASDYMTRELMTSYYKNLKQGVGRGEALREVQLETLRRRRHLHPFYWANFIHSGEWADLDGKR